MDFICEFLGKILREGFALMLTAYNSEGSRKMQKKQIRIVVDSTPVGEFWLCQRIVFL